MEDQAYLVITDRFNEVAFGKDYSYAYIVRSKEEAIELLHEYAATPTGTDRVEGVLFTVANGKPFALGDSSNGWIEWFEDSPEGLSVAKIPGEELDPELFVSEYLDKGFEWPIYAVKPDFEGKAYIAFNRSQILAYGHAEKLMSFSVREEVREFTGSPEEVVWWHK